MRTLDPGHAYKLDVYDGDGDCILIFMKRSGSGYPGNVGRHCGTNCQEVLRALIDRVQYLQAQEACSENDQIIEHLRNSLKLFEVRAARRHGLRNLLFRGDVEKLKTCVKCGHVVCGHHR